MLKAQLCRLASQYPSYGFQTFYGMLCNQGYRCNHKRLRRLYCELKLHLRRRPKKRLAPRSAQVLVVPKQANHTWSIDFMSDALSLGRRFRTRNVLDDHGRECLGIKIAFTLPATLVTQYLLQEVNTLTKQWIKHYNHERPHQALQVQPPVPNTDFNFFNQENSLSKWG